MSDIGYTCDLCIMRVNTRLAIIHCLFTSFTSIQLRSTRSYSTGAWLTPEPQSIIDNWGVHEVRQSNRSLHVTSAVHVTGRECNAKPKQPWQRNTWMQQLTGVNVVTELCVIDQRPVLWSWRATPQRGQRCAVISNCIDDTCHLLQCAVPILTRGIICHRYDTSSGTLPSQELITSPLADWAFKSVVKMKCLAIGQRRHELERWAVHEPHLALIVILFNEAHNVHHGQQCGVTRPNHSHARVLLNDTRQLWGIERRLERNNRWIAWRFSAVRWLICGHVIVLYRRDAPCRKQDTGSSDCSVVGEWQVPPLINKWHVIQWISYLTTFRHCTAKVRHFVQETARDVFEHACSISERTTLVRCVLQHVLPRTARTKSRICEQLEESARGLEVRHESVGASVARHLSEHTQSPRLEIRV